MAIKNICIIDGHPDPDSKRLVHALCETYKKAAIKAGHSVKLIKVADVSAQPLRSVESFESKPDPIIEDARNDIKTCDHIVLAFPLWLGSMPSATRALFEQMARDNFFLDTSDGTWPKRLMKGKSARIIVTMGMPGFVYKTVFSGAAIKAIERNILGISGFKPVKHTIIGGVGTSNEKQVNRWFETLSSLGTAGE